MSKVQLAMLNWDQLSSNNHVGDVSFKEELVEGASRRDEKTGLYEGEVGVVGEWMREYKLPLALAEVVP
jgi:phosphatidylserine decarboxylase